MASENVAAPDAAPDAEPDLATLVRRTLPHQQRVFDFYNSDIIQIGVAIVIGANFLTNIIEKEIDPKGRHHTDNFKVCEIIYNVIFTIELGINIYGHWWCEFWKSGWNIFDTVVVTIGIVTMINVPLPSSFRLLRMMRAFRVFRLFKRIESLNQIIVAIGSAVPGVSNAFLILGIVMSIYAILAVEFYHKMADDCHSQPNSNWITTRGFCWGEEYFGCFSKSLFTFFQVLTGDSWSEMVARPCIWYWHESPVKAYGGAFFFVSYVLITAFMLINVVVACLLDGMQTPQPADAESNGEVVAKGEPTPTVTIEALEQKVAQLISSRDTLKRSLESFRGEMAELKEKLAAVHKAITSG